MSRGTLTITVAPSKRGLQPVVATIEVEDVERAMQDLHDAAPGVQLLDLVLRIARRL